MDIIKLNYCSLFFSYAFLIIIEYIQTFLIIIEYIQTLMIGVLCHNYHLDAISMRFVLTQNLYMFLQHSEVFNVKYL